MAFVDSWILIGNPFRNGGRTYTHSQKEGDRGEKKKKNQWFKLEVKKKREKEKQGYCWFLRIHESEVATGIILAVFS